jgi:type II secretory ATPase GspE/PulE/Tfp pilus assembly ATPase PilB-like protein
MGVEPFLVASSVIGVVAQRLTRIICPRCKKPYEASVDEFKKIAKVVKAPTEPTEATAETTELTAEGETK